MPILLATDKKKALLAYKEKLFNDIKYYDKRINEYFQDSASISTNFEDSSDSEDDCPFTIVKGPMLAQLKTQQNMLRTGLHATQELSSLCVMQSKVDIVVEDPVITGEPPVTKPGLWREVNVDCRIDLVTFLATFYVHQANDSFGAKSYRGLKVMPMKPAQEVELSKSLLSRVATPSDAIEVLRNYSVAYRSRRTTLAKLADKYAHNLFMEPVATGGYLLKCANLLEISWVLENKWSRVAPFYHKMIFDVEEMDECYIKIIRNAHKQLGDPSTDTNERTLILAKIIATCLEARDTQQLDENIESDTESVQKIEKRRLTLENEAPEAKKMRNSNKNNDIEDVNARDNISNKHNTNIDDQIMAPPKSLPKKVKPKGKESTDQSRKCAKRPAVENEAGTAKKAKSNKNDPNNIKQNENDKNKEVDKKIQNNSQDQKNTDGKNKTRASKIQISTKLAKEVEREVTKEIELKSNHNEKEQTTEHVKGHEKVSRGKNLINEFDKNQNNEKESVKDTQKDKIIKSQKGKIIKSKNKEDETVVKENDDLHQAIVSSKKTKQNVNIQEKPTKKVPKSTDSQKVVNIDNISASSQNDPKAKKTEIANDKNVNTQSKKDSKPKNSETQKVRSKDKIPPSSKNDPKVQKCETKKLADVNIVTSQSKKSQNKQNFETQKVDSKYISKNDVNKPNQPNNEKNVISSKTVESITEINAKRGSNIGKLAVIDDIPIISANNIEIDELPKRFINNVKKIQKGVIKSAYINQKDQKNVNKFKRNFDLANINKNKESNAKNVKKSIVKETNSNTELVSSDSAVSKNKLIKNSNLKNVEIQNQKAKKKENNSKDVQKPNTLNLKPIQKATVKIVVNSKTVSNKEGITKASKNNKENSEKNPKLTEKQANKKEHVVKIKQNVAKTEGPKMVIKNFVTSKKTVKNLNISDGIKKVTNSKTDKENDSGSKFSKIPMILSSIHGSLKKNNPLRMSPRLLPSTFKSTSDSNMKQKKYFTNIPRLTKNNCV